MSGTSIFPHWELKTEDVNSRRHDYLVDHLHFKGLLRVHGGPLENPGQWKMQSTEPPSVNRMILYNRIIRSETKPVITNN